MNGGKSTAIIFIVTTVALKCVSCQEINILYCKIILKEALFCTENGKYFHVAQSSRILLKTISSFHLMYFSGIYKRLFDP